jgi:hypothetical protein
MALYPILVLKKSPDRLIGSLYSGDYYVIKTV